MRSSACGALCAAQFRKEMRERSGSHGNALLQEVAQGKFPNARTIFPAPIAPPC